jgi:DNA-binding protein H-NS
MDMATTHQTETKAGATVSVAELLRQTAELEAQIARQRAEEKAAGIAKAKAVIDEYGLTQEDLFGVGAARAKRGPAASSGEVRTVAAKYRDANGNTWSGRGLKPRWLSSALAAGASLDSFKI